MYENPYAGLTTAQIYEGLMDGRPGWPRWPDIKTQAGYTGTNGVQLLQRAFDFVDILVRDGAFVEDWHGLDYGCGWGRFASALLSIGGAERLDICDAWPRTLVILNKLGYANRVIQVPELLEDDVLPRSYDFVLSFSVFTHLSPDAFRHNLGKLLTILTPGGRVYITVRHDEFLDHKYGADAAKAREELEKSGVWYSTSGGDMGKKAIFGDTVVTPRFIESIGKATYLGQPHSLQHVYRVEPAQD